MGLSSRNLIICRFCRIAFNVVSSPVLLTAVVKYHLHKEIREARREGKVEEVEALQQLHN